MSARKAIDILLVEDNPGDVRLTLEAFRDAQVPNQLNWVTNGVDALAYLRREGAHVGATCPDLILLDLKLPRKDGREFLQELRADRALQHLPVVVLTSSFAEEDMVRASESRANAYLTKPFDMDSFVEIARSIDRFWQTISHHPPASSQPGAESGIR